MAGIGQADEPLVSAGLAAQPLVTSADPSITGSAAVSNLVDAFHKGFINQDDIVSRIGEEGQAKKKALLQQLGEYVSPDAIDNRLAALKAGTAQAGLVGQQATAEQGLVQAKHEFEALQLGMASANLSTSNGVQAYQQLAPMYRLPASIYKADGKTLDLDEMGRLGNVLVAHDFNNRYGIPDTSIPPQKGKDASGNEITTYYNRYKLPISKTNQDAAHRAIDVLNPQIAAAQYLHPISGQPRTGSPLVTPIGVNQVPTGPLVVPGGTPAPAPAASPAPAPAPVKEASAAPEPLASQYARPNILGLGDTDPATGGEITSEPQVQDIQKEMRATNEHKEWSTQSSRVHMFTSQAKMPSNPTNDKALAHTVFNMLTGNPGGQMNRSNEETWKEAVGRQPWLNNFTEIPQLLLAHKDLLSMTRKDLIDLGKATIDAGDQNIFPTLAQAVNQIPTKYPPNKVLNGGREMEVYQKGMSGKLDRFSPPESSSSPVQAAPRTASQAKVGEIINTHDTAGNSVRVKREADGTWTRQ